MINQTAFITTESLLKIMLYNKIFKKLFKLKIVYILKTKRKTLHNRIKLTEKNKI
jgi:hypothetical protein